ncbi:hypothetical protein EFQ36_01160, partial [Limosilactobacillus fermentum]|uniref:hypothetical protein n=1 Tax=Limosilactobacillus fermentum TaxID=1613 RepID=UPI0021A3C698
GGGCWLEISLRAKHGPLFLGAGHLYTVEVDQIKKSYLYQIAHIAPFPYFTNFSSWILTPIWG